MEIVVHQVESPIDAYDLAALHEVIGDTFSYPLPGTRLSCYRTTDGVPHKADRMVSHLGARVSTCAAHEEAAAQTAKDYYDLHGA
ncbi:hypothetical protein [Streptomyces sp. CBG9]|uniref:hypothetical protein n=1 Tax=Streptomyces sp. CBG9 TaxID=2762622 RepID=UPI001644897E|nr:hypothetical protein [Streptomyces sp. CBG9]